MGNYKYRFSGTSKKEETRKLLIEDLRRIGLVPSETNDTVTVEGEAQFEVCMGYLSRFLHFDEHEFYLTRKG